MVLDVIDPSMPGVKPAGHIDSAVDDPHPAGLDDPVGNLRDLEKKRNESALNEDAAQRDLDEYEATSKRLAGELPA